MKRIVFIKLGGSIISDKTKVNTARIDSIKKIVEQIKKLLSENKDLSVVLFTGAGGFGHPVAEKYKDNLKTGLSEIKNAVKKINGMVVSILSDFDLKAQSLEPDKLVKYENKKMVSLSYSFLTSLLEKNVIPVFHADLVNDKKLGIIILSMDKFLVDCAIYFKNKGYRIEKAIFLGPTKGVVDSSGKTILTINKKTYSRIKNIFYQGLGVDVSGGMKSKVEEGLRLADNGIESCITDSIFSKGTFITAD